ncbi:AraC family transcriptional regulator [Pseudoalteromonas sp. BSi20652]|jgi:AraC family transcriptional regulator|uniref:AraC family transcriptional regulator n=1 Tax=Pseudoalteromonas sp. BSi20652 TaxID=388384 RepID=UPI000231961D|nr:AraC family transcriptional regulator [Pseudoalteromonas sp. BSi20652]GAA58255.1 AraC family transcriptional regulator [Pseudoalteromonas sp. BSi20652]
MVDKYSLIVNRVAQYVYEHFDEPLTISDLSDKFTISKYHINRLFFAHTGMNIGEFIQRRRLEYAFNLLADQDHSYSVLEVAVHVGYESHAAFSRAFHRLFDIEPKQVKHNKTPHFSLAKLIKQPKRHDIEGKLLTLPEKTIMGLYGQGFENQSYFAIAQQLYQEVAQELNLTDGFDFEYHQLIGVSIDNPWRIEQSQSRFFAGISEPEETNFTDKKSEKLVPYVMPEGLWVRFEHKGPYHTMWQTILNIYASWFSKHDYQLRDSALVQHYVNDVTLTPPQDLITHIYVALLER